MNEEIDMSRPAIEDAVSALREGCDVAGYFSNATLHKFGDLMETLAHEVNALRSRSATRELLLKEVQANCDGLEAQRDELETFRLMWCNLAVERGLELEQLKADAMALHAKVNNTVTMHAGTLDNLLPKDK